MLYKIWSKINQIEDVLLRHALALLDLNTHTGRHVASRLPELFTKEKPKEAGPVPLSIIRERAEMHPDFLDCFLPRRNHIVTQGALEFFGLPVIEFACTKEAADMIQMGGGKLPLIPPKLEAEVCKKPVIGKGFDWHGKKIVLIEFTHDWCCDDEAKTIFFLPAECILVDIKWPSDVDDD